MEKCTRNLNNLEKHLAVMILMKDCRNNIDEPGEVSEVQFKKLTAKAEEVYNNDVNFCLELLDLDLEVATQAKLSKDLAQMDKHQETVAALSVWVNCKPMLDLAASPARTVPASRSKCWRAARSWRRRTCAWSPWRA